jgi:hypothetical protein
MYGKSEYGKDLYGSRCKTNLTCDMISISEMLKSDKTIIDAKMIKGIQNREKLNDVKNYWWSMIKLMRAGETEVMTYVELLRKLRDFAGDTELYKRIYECFRVLLAHDPNMKGKSIDHLMVSPDYDIKVSKETLEKLERCLINAVIHIDSVAQN